VGLHNSGLRLTFELLLLFSCWVLLTRCRVTGPANPVLHLARHVTSRGRVLPDGIGLQDNVVDARLCNRPTISHDISVGGRALRSLSTDT
jgi:hypothetical protein